VPMTEDGGGISPLLALAMALTVVASAFTYWQGREADRARSSVPGSGPDDSSTAGPVADDPGTNGSGADGSGADGSTDGSRVIRLPDDNPQSSSERESRSIFAP
jgi:hypothetical protein